MGSPISVVPATTAHLVLKRACHSCVSWRASWERARADYDAARSIFNRGYGIQTAPALARLTAELIAGPAAAAGEIAAAVSPARFAAPQGFSTFGQ